MKIRSNQIPLLPFVSFILFSFYMKLTLADPDNNQIITSATTWVGRGDTAPPRHLNTWTLDTTLKKQKYVQNTIFLFDTGIRVR